jgi:Ca-activated chloride channel family protein
MHWAYTDMIGVSGATAALGGLALLALVSKRRRLRRLATLPMTPSLLLVRRSVQFLKAGLIVAAMALLAVAQLGPQWGQVPADEEPVHGRDLLVLLDVSRSMLARDVAPSRLERAKADIRDLLVALKQRGGCRVGLITFADRAALLCPLTSDFRAFEEELTRASLATLRVRGDSGSRDGTQMGSALTRAEHAIPKDVAPYTDVLLISDGGDMEQDTLAAADRLGEAGVSVHAVGLGDAVEGSFIPVRGRGGAEEYLTYRGTKVRVRLEEDVLREVARRTSGQYVGVGTGFLPLDRWFDSVLAGKQDRALLAGASHHVFEHRFQWLLAPALALLVLEMLLADGTRKALSVGRKPNYFAWVSRRRPRALAHSTERTTLQSF